MADTAYNIEESLGFMASTANRLLYTTLRRAFKEAGLDLMPEQWGILVFLWEKGSATQEELVQTFCVDKSSMSRILSLMEEKGLVARMADPANERKKHVRAAAGADAVRERGFAAAGSVLGAAARGINPNDAATCMTVLARIKSNLRDAS